MNATCLQCGKVVTVSGGDPSLCPSCQGALLLETNLDATRAYAPTSREASPASVAESQLVGDYRLVRKLGQGGMGAVWEAEHTESGRRVALKLLSPNMAPTVEAIERFLREARLAASLSHPRSTFVFGAGDHEGQPFIVMELMPGRTLHDVVAEKGPLPVPQAVDYVLDVIDGLEAAHALNVIHRDVKPSNCFLDGDGRVKIGDFGLSKSLVTEPHLTRTGAFLGTPMFAAPEQVRGGEADQRTDVYGVIATLYYLLAKRGPFSGDAVAVIAQIASDPPMPLRKVVPHAPEALEQIIARALEKDPTRRYHDLAQLRQALLPFATGGTSIADVWRRLGAYTIDMIAIGLVGAFVTVLIQIALAAIAISGGSSHGTMQNKLAPQFMGSLTGFVFQLGYFAITEWRWGCGFGKWLMGLRVVGADGERPALWQSAIRSWFIPGAFGAGLLTPLYLWFFSPEAPLPNQPVVTRDMLIAMYLGGAYYVVVLLCLTTMRSRNGYRGIHEFASGTRVIRLKLATAAVAWGDVPLVAATELTGPARSFGPFRAQGHLGKIDGSNVLLAHDELLHRHVWILESPTQTEISPERRIIARPTRPRWLQGGGSGDHWDAIEAIHGAPLPAWLADVRRLEWIRARRVLHDLANELQAGLEDGSLPPRLSLEQVWIDRVGRTRLLEAPLTTDGEEVRSGETSTTGDKAVGAVALLRSAAALCCDPESLPVHALSLIQELNRRPNDAETLAWAAHELNSVIDRPARLDWAFRMATLAVSMGIEGAVYTLSCMVIPLSLWTLRQFSIATWAGVSVAICMLLPALMGFAFRGGPAFRFMQVEVRRRDGTAASRLRCAWRSFTAYAGWVYFYSLMGLMFAGLAVSEMSGTATAQSDFQLLKGGSALQSAVIMISVCSGELMLLLSIVGVVYAMVHPQRGLQDLLAGTRLVPR